MKITINNAELHCKYCVAEVIGADPQRSRLLSLGFSRGKEIFLDYRCSDTGPFIVGINDQYVALRKNEAECIQIQRN